MHHRRIKLEHSAKGRDKIVWTMDMLREGCSKPVSI